MTSSFIDCRIWVVVFAAACVLTRHRSQTCCHPNLPSSTSATHYKGGGHLTDIQNTRR